MLSACVCVGCLWYLWQDIPGAEDDGTLNAHIQVMCNEMNKAVPSTAVIDDRMTPLPELMNKFPALKLDDQVHKVNMM